MPTCRPCPTRFLQQLFKHPLTDIGIELFNRDWVKVRGAAQGECTTLAKNFARKILVPALRVRRTDRGLDRPGGDRGSSLMQRKTDGHAESLLQSGTDAGTVYPASNTGAALDETQRRNAIVVATEQVAPAVVSITSSYTVHTRPMYDWFFNRYYPSRSQTRPKLGSGVIIDKRGYVFTNYHVVSNAERLQVTLFDGKSYAATLVRQRPSYDLALIKLDGDNFRRRSAGRFGRAS